MLIPHPGECTESYSFDDSHNSNWLISSPADRYADLCAAGMEATHPFGACLFLMQQEPFLLFHHIAHEFEFSVGAELACAGKGTSLHRVRRSKVAQLRRFNLKANMLGAQVQAGMEEGQPSGRCEHCMTALRLQLAWLTQEDTNDCNWCTRCGAFHAYQAQ